MVYYGCHTAHDLAVVIGKEALSLAKLERGVGAGLQRQLLGKVEVWHGVWAVAIKVVKEIDESLALLACRHFDDLDVGT